MPDRPVDERLVADVARGLRGDADLPFSARQLWYAVCARMERPEVTQATAQIVAGAVLCAIGVVFGILATVFVAAVVPVGMIIIGLGLQNRRYERHRPTTRALAVGYDAFLRQTVEPMRARGGDALRGLLDVDAAAAGEPAAPDPEAPLVVCDRAETAVVLTATAAAAGLRVEVVDERGLGSPPASRRIHTLHDADPRACAMPIRLASAGAGDVVDLGLRPGHITGRRIQVIEGAPYMVPRELSVLLTADEIMWLADGRRVELAILSPAELVEGLRRALDAPAVAPPGAAPPRVTLAAASPIPPLPGAARAIPPEVEAA
ncbi:MAG TPA: hypothetical protein VFO60_03255 [Candidatus Dormibacteraeota bacterium]|nr:hypothetical protein [Candidatus Dormibacteraeota bacterium]